LFKIFKLFLTKNLFMPAKKLDVTVKPFNFKQFAIYQDKCAMKVGTDGVLLGAWADVSDAKMMLDIGTGTGVIAMMMAQRNTEATVHGVEVDEMSHEQANENMKNSPFASRLESYLIDIQSYSKVTDRKYDMIVSNPPFFTGGTLSANQDKTNVRHTVKLPHGDLLMAVKNLLQTNGRFCVILPLIEGLRFKELAERAGLFCTKLCEVQPKAQKGVERLLLQFEQENRPLERSVLIIQAEEGRHQFTKEYADLVRDFYTIL
jgi:tRNA1Val (adenine37-N6)-methyltransferase